MYHKTIKILVPDGGGAPIVFRWQIFISCYIEMAIKCYVYQAEHNIFSISRLGVKYAEC